MKTKIFAILILLFFVGALFWIVPILKNRYFQSPAEESGQTENISNNQPGQKQEEMTDNSAPMGNTANNSSGTATPNSAVKNTDQIDKADTGQELLDITKKDCADNCANFKKDKKNLQYCQQRCGLSPKTTTTSSGCDSLKDLEKDYCWKDLAISKTDLTICEKISDDGIKKTCQNRIAEDILDAQKN